MKQWITLFAATAFFTACSKQDLQEDQLNHENKSASTVLRSSQDGAYISGWESYNQWAKTDDGVVSVFTINRKTSEVGTAAGGGLVLGYAKINTSNPLYLHLSKPTMLPFYYLPQAEKPHPGMYYFSEIVSGENIVLQYRMPFTKAETATLPGGASLQDLQFQHVVLSKAFLDSRGLSAGTVQNYYTYDQVIALVNP
jgi:hypothetical protein